jgi:hypothetical protein
MARRFLAIITHNAVVFAGLAEWSAAICGKASYLYQAGGTEQGVRRRAQIDQRIAGQLDNAGDPATRARLRAAACQLPVLCAQCARSGSLSELLRGEALRSQEKIPADVAEARGFEPRMAAKPNRISRLNAVV